MDVEHSQLGDNGLEGTRVKRLGHDVYKLQRCGNWEKMNESILLFLSDQVAIQFNMLCTLMEGGVLSNVDC